MSTHRLTRGGSALLAILVIVLAGPALVGPMHAQTAPAASSPVAQTASPATARAVRQPDQLPVRRVVLYKNGVGYFEHLGKVRGNQTVTIDFTSGQLDDALKSLTTLDLDGGRVAGVSYNSEAALGRQLGALRLPLGEQATRAQLLNALRGARLDVGGATRATGRLLSVESVEQRGANDTVTTVDTISLVTDAGGIHTVTLTPGVSVRIVDTDLSREVGRYLSLVAAERDQDTRRLSISATGAGERDLFVSYISEVPVWKSTYRLVLPSASSPGRPLLQGWAVVDNTVGEDWENVELSLVAGAPQSFIQSISQPLYLQRPVVPFSDRLMTSPQTHQAALKAGNAESARDSISESIALPSAAPAVPPPPPAPPAFRSSGGGGGRGGGAFRPNGNIMLDGISPVAGERVDAARQLQQSQADAAELGDLFEYTLREPITIRKNQSALVPILSGDVTAEKVSLWSPSSGSPRPLRAVWLTNTTGLTLDGGSFTIIEGQAFAGEGLVDPLKAGEKRLLSYALDLGVQVEAKTEGAPVRTTRVQMSRGVMITQTEQRQKQTYTIRNDDTEARSVVIEHPVRAGWNIGGTMKPTETTAAWYRYRVPVAAKTTATFDVEETRPSQTQVQITNVTDQQVAVLVRDQTLTAPMEAALREMLARKAAIAALAANAAARQRDIDEISRDQTRVRENLQALKGSAEEKQLVQRYVRQLDEQETRLQGLRKEQQDIQTNRARAEADLARFIESVAF